MKETDNMIIYTSNNLRLYETCSLYPNSDWTGNAEYIIDELNPDNQNLIDKIKEYAPYFDYILDDNGKLIDVVKTQDKPELESPTYQDPLSILYNENKILKSKVQALTESNQFLEDCIIELAETVYA